MITEQERRDVLHLARESIADRMGHPTDRQRLASAFLAEVQKNEELERKLKNIIDEARSASRILDGIAFELNASVYTLTDEEFEKVFMVRDFLSEALRRNDKAATDEK